jgi:sigma-B regulation protein RsbU (phosphoserine phosphatase)
MQSVGMEYINTALGQYEIMTRLPEISPEASGTDERLAQVRRQQERDRRALDLLYRVGMACQSLSSDRVLFEMLVRELCDVFALDSCYIALCDLDRPNIFRTALLYDEGLTEYVEGVEFGPITARMVRERIPLRIGDLNELRSTLDQYPTTFGNTQKLSRAWMGVPLLLDESALGVIALQSYTANQFSADDHELLQRIGQVVAVALENANLIQHQRNLSDELAARVSARTEELAALSAIVTEMVLQQPLPTLLERVLARTLPLLDAAAGNVRVLDRERDVLVLLAQRGLPPDDARTVAEVSVSGSLFGKVVRENQPLVVERDLAEVALRKGPSAFESLLGIPLRIGERVIGTMALLDTRPRAFAVQQIDLAQLIGNQLAIAIENARLLAQRDRQILELSALAAISQAAITSHNLQMLQRQVYAALRDLMALDSFVMSVYDAARDVIVEGIGIDEGQTYQYFTRNAPPTPGSFTAWVIHNRRMLHLRDVAADMAHYPELVSVLSGSGRPAASWLGVPLHDRDEHVLGTIVVQSYSIGAFDERDERFLQNVAQQTALHVQNVALLAQRDRQIRELDAIGRIGELVSASFDLDEILQGVYETLSAATGAPIFYFLLCEAGTHIITNAMFIEQGQHNDLGWVGASPQPDSLTDRILQRREPLLYDDLLEYLKRSADPQVRPKRFGKQQHARAWAGVPLLARDGEAIGVLSVQHYEPNQYDGQTIEFLSQVASQVGLGVQKIKLLRERERQIRELDAIGKVGRLVSASFELDHMLQVVYELLEQVTGAAAFYMVVCAPRSHIVTQTFYIERGKRLPDEWAGSAPPPDSLTGWILRQRQPLLFVDLRSEEERLSALGIAPIYMDNTVNPRAWVGVPLLAEDSEPIGMISVQDEQPDRFDAQTVELLSQVASHLSLGVQKIHLFQERERLFHESVSRVEQELEIARRIQTNLFPRTLPSIPGIAIAARAVLARETGGDFYDIVQLAGDRFGLLVGDASGKSIPGALLMAVARSTARSEALDHELPEMVMHETNRLIAQDVPPRSFVALSYASLDPARRRLALANAGQLSPLRRRADGTVEYLDVPGPTLPLGIQPETEYAALEILLEPGDTLVFYTDGIVEAHDPRRALFGFERLEALVREYGALTPTQLIETVLEEVETFASGTPQHDDMTMLVLHVADTP